MVLHHIFQYTDYRGLQQVIPMIENESCITGTPNVNSDRKFYYINGTTVWYWDDSLTTPNFRPMTNYDGELCYLLPSDWRTELYFQGLEEMMAEEQAIPAAEESACCLDDDIPF